MKSKYQHFFYKLFLWDHLIEIIYELELRLEKWLNVLDLSLNFYFGIIFIVIGLIVRVDLKFSMQKDLQ